MGYTLRDLHQILFEGDNKWQFLYDNGLLLGQRVCPKCGVLCNAYAQKAWNYFQCPVCLKTSSYTAGSIFHKARLPIEGIVLLLYYYARKTHPSEIQYEINVSAQAITDWFKVFRGHISLYVQGLPPIGGLALDVEVDECALAKQKYHVGRLPNIIWVIGAIERRTGEIRMARIPNRTAQVMGWFIRRNINTGSIVHTDQHKGYLHLDNPASGYVHLTVCHKTNFVDPVTGSYTQTIERNWVEVRCDKMERRGYEHEYIQDYLDEIVFRKHLRIRGVDAFLAVMQLCQAK